MVTILGFIAGDGEEILNIIPMNTEDNFLHLLLTIAGFGAGLATPAREPSERAAERGSGVVAQAAGSARGAAMLLAA